MVGICEFYAGKTIFLTGVTGLVGKLVLEKLLRSCNGLERIYVLVRPKKGKDSDQRIKEICGGVAFDRLKTLQSNFLEKITIIEGDLEHQSAFKIADEILEQIDIVVHCAATVRFNEPIKKATFINVRGTKQVLDVARKMKKLVSFVYVSTAFSFCPHSTIDEKIYEVPMDAASLIAKMEQVSDEVWLNEFERRIVPEWPNTYALTKAITESMLLDYNDLPIAVARPSILLGCAKEPIAGWMDNVMGVTGMMIGVGVGIVRTVMVYENLITDIVPVDYAVNLIIAAAWDVGNRASKTIKIFNCVSGPHSSITWKDISTYSLPIGIDVAPSIKALWYPVFISVRSRPVYNLLLILLHTIPGKIFDVLAIIQGRKERLSKIYKKADDAMASLIYFTTRQWTFKDNNTRQLLKRMDDEERRIFYFDMDGFDWKQMIYDCSMALRYYVVGDPKETIEPAKKRMFKLKIIHYTTVAFLFWLFVWFLYLLYSFLF